MNEYGRNQIAAALIERCDRDFERRLKDVAEKILAERDLRLVRLSGPTCSGKTTAANMLSRHFAENGRRAVTVSIDDFFFDTSLLLKKTCGDGIDYDSPDTIDVAALEAFVEEIFLSDTVHCPIFDFHSGSRTGYRELEIGKNDIIIFEGIQAVYPSVTEMLSHHSSRGVFIMPMSTIDAGGEHFEPNEIRLLRRIVRDYNFRSAPPEFTFFLWNSVRKNEETNIFPYISSCEYFIDSSMPYGIGVLKPYLETILSQIREESEWRGRADEILASVSCVEPLPASLIGERSLYREFV